MNRFVTHVFIILQFLITSFSYAFCHTEILIESEDLPREVIDSTLNSVRSIARLIEDQDGGEINRLRRRAYDSVMTSLAVEGYFCPIVNFDVSNEGCDEKWKISIISGKRAIVSKVNLRFTGRISYSDYEGRIEELRNSWFLPVGKVFTNNDWASAKKKLLYSITSRDFLLARITNSEAKIDTAAAEVELSLVIDSGPLVLTGEVHTHGFVNIPSSLVYRYTNYKQNKPFNQDLLDDWQQYLQSTKFFSGAFITIDSMHDNLFKKNIFINNHEDKYGLFNFDNNLTINSSQLNLSNSDNKEEVTLPVHVIVIESPLKQMVSSIGIDDGAAGLRFESVYKQNMVGKFPLTLSSGVGVDRLHKRLFVDINLLPGANGKRDSFGVLLDTSDAHGLKVTRSAFGFTRSNNGYNSIYQDKNSISYETSYQSLLAYDYIDIKHDRSFSLPTVTNTFSVSRFHVDSKYNPKQGNISAMSMAIGLSLNKISPYARIKFRSQSWWPVFNNGVATLRAEFGKIWPSNNQILIPDDFGFRIGGARSIRGYAYQSIGSQRGFAVVGASMMSVVSAEYNHYFNERFGCSYFIDLGDAFNFVNQMRLSLGYGIGLRVRTPAGPLSLDLAYSYRFHNLKLHFSLGIVF
ncbi:MAG: BamA/TamA family outer membrane protein [Candidatus Kinetoplastibacterium crithidii]|nr:BamA/TamA family outer membrane protein [Candidatus Kinetoplastibacterium crithidii]